jgi:hypothetical protein
MITGLWVGNALALRMCLCLPTFRFRQTESAYATFLAGETCTDLQNGAANWRCMESLLPARNRCFFSFARMAALPHEFALPSAIFALKASLACYSSR